jgi:hypothetical protein
MTDVPLDRNIALDLVRVTEAAALAASRWMGRGDKIAADQAAMKRRYVRSARHTMQVDFWRYAHALKQCRKRTGEQPSGVAALMPKALARRLTRASA